MKSSALLISVISFNALVSAQQFSIPVPLNIRELYNGTTRSMDGRPGENYWQNSADYELKAEFDPVTRKTTGEGIINYKNNSPDTLKEIVMFLYQNIYQKGADRDFSIHPDDVNDGVQITSFKINGLDYDYNKNSLEMGTISELRNLPQSILPGTSVRIEVEWNFLLPSKLPLRMGAYSENVFFAAYWFPRVGVYDDVEGWDFNSYNGAIEFYNDFGNFNVEITVPGNYLVWATGQLKNAEEIYTESILERYNNAKSSDETVKIVTAEDYADGKALTRNDINTWKYSAENVSDFSFACAEKYLWDGSNLNIGGKDIFIDAAYPDSAAHYNEAVEYSKRAIEFSSNELPGVMFPFPKFTTFCNGRKSFGGMETPMMANNNAPKEKILFINLIAHEIWHTYFPFYAGTNEKKYSWMDEAWMSYLPSVYLPQFDSTFHYINERKSRDNIKGSEYETPSMAISAVLNWQVTASTSYIKSMFALNALNKMLEEVFKEAIRDFIDNWKWKHPIPYDLFLTFNRVAGEDLSWFWKPWFFEFGYTDLAINWAEGGNSIEVSLAGNQPVPVKVSLHYTDGGSEIIEKNPRVWKNSKSVVIRLGQNKKIRSAKIITDEINDYDPSNDELELAAGN